MVTGCADGGTARLAPDPAEPEPCTLSQTLTVVALEDGRVVLGIERAAACAGCAARSGCGAAALAEMAPDQRLSVVPPPGLSLVPGDSVVVSMPTAPFLTAAGLAYLLPPAAIAAAAAGFSALGLPDPVVLLLSLLVLALSFLPLRLAEREGGLIADLRVEATAGIGGEARSGAGAGAVTGMGPEARAAHREWPA
ncbi:MAG: SoxR reducing system RseC family protein [Pseudomonadota bacterium]